MSKHTSHQSRSDSSSSPRVLHIWLKDLNHLNYRETKRLF